MNKIIFTDLNEKLVTKVKKIHKETINNTHCELIAVNLDVLKTKKKYPNALIITASNPDFNMGGGLDAFKFTNNLFFIKSCDENLKTNKKIIQRALLGVYFASRKNDIIITGIGTQIAGLSINDFLDEYKKFIFALLTSVLLTSVLLTSVLLTSVLLTSILLTSVMLTSVLLTSVLLTSVLLTSVMLTSILLTSVMLTSVLLTSVLLTSVLLTSVLLTSILLTSVMLTSVMLTSILLTSVMLTSVMLTSILLTSQTQDLILE